MQALIFEPRVSRKNLLQEKLESVGLDTEFVDGDFFDDCAANFGSYGLDGQAILIAESATTNVLIRAIRRSGSKIPIIAFFDTKNSDETEVLLNSGADDVVSSPFTGGEVLSRINSILRRSHGHASESVSVGEITFYFDGREPVVSGAPIELSKREYQILSFLALNAGKTVSKNAIYDALYSTSPDQPYDKVIDVYICKLRKKITQAANSGFKYILTVRGRGYKLAAE
jgi:two-component system cell cycle response regulator CtrA